MGSVGRYLEKGGESEGRAGGREEMLKKIEEIGESIAKVEEDIKKVNKVALDGNDIDKLKESHNNLAKYLEAIKIIESNVADLKYQISLRSLK